MKQDFQKIDIDCELSPILSLSNFPNRNEKRVAEKYKNWLNHEMNSEEKEIELFKMQVILFVYLIVVYEINPDLVKNPNLLKTTDLKFTVNQLGKKLSRSGHIGDVLPYDIFKLPTTLPRLQSFDDSPQGNVQYYELLFIGTQQIRGLIKESEKKFILQYKNLNSDGEGEKYEPILLCINRPSNIAILLKLPSLKELPNFTFVSTYGLDDYQVKMIDSYNFLPPRMDSRRKVDEILVNKEYELLPKALQNPSRLIRELVDDFIKNYGV